MAIIIDAIAMAYTVIISFDELLAPPPALRSATVKLSIQMLDLFFIGSEIANVGIAFWSKSKIRPEAPRRAYIRQNALISVLMVALVAWQVTFSIGLIRIFKRIDNRNQDRKRAANRG
ncbi:MAG: hypothetical protein Q9182_003389 [Xanthomendoza sp. 2 TL-2023]